MEDVGRTRVVAAVVVALGAHGDHATAHADRAAETVSGGRIRGAEFLPLDPHAPDAFEHIGRPGAVTAVIIAGGADHDRVAAHADRAAEPVVGRCIAGDQDRVEYPGIVAAIAGRAQNTRR